MRVRRARGKLTALEVVSDLSRECVVGRVLCLELMQQGSEEGFGRLALLVLLGQPAFAPHVKGVGARRKSQT